MVPYQLPPRERDIYWVEESSESDILRLSRHRLRMLTRRIAIS